MPKASRKKSKAKPKKPVQSRPPARKPAPKPPVKSKVQTASPGRVVAPRPGTIPASGPAKAGPARAGASKAAQSKPGATGGSKKGGRRSGLLQRRGPNGELLSPGDILLPGGVQGGDEIQYLFRGVVAAEHPAGEVGIQEILAKRTGLDESEKGELAKQLHAMNHRFEAGSIEPQLPPRPQTPRRSFQTVVERAKHRRREIGAFLRGLDLGRTETSHMDSHGEASLQSLMEWAARLENLAEADEPEQADYAMFHRGLDQLESTTEALIIDVELTLRRLRDRNRAS
jgi:hypothetical protein